MKVGVIQSNYIPWKGYFDFIHDVDIFIFYDDVQFTKNDWRNRNKIKTVTGPSWLSIPVGQSLDRLIHEVKITDSSWQKKHWKTLEHNYSKALHFDRYRDFFRTVYLEKQWSSLSELNHYLITTISKDFLAIKTEFQDSRSFRLTGTKQERLMDLLKQVKARTYISGPNGKNYLNETAFLDAGIELKFKDYSGYPEYSQLYPPFDHQVSIIDVLFNCGPDAPFYIWQWREKK